MSNSGISVDQYWNIRIGGYIMERKRLSIKWVDVETKIVSIDKYNEILKEIKDLKIREHKVQDIGSVISFAGTYQIKRCESYIEIRLLSPEGAIK